MITRDNYVIALIESLQDDLFVMDKEEVWDVLEHILDVLYGEEE